MGIIHGFHIKDWKTTPFVALYNGRTDISHIVKAQEIILINLTNTIVQSIVMIYSHILMFMLGEEVGVAWSGGRRALFPLDQIFQNTLYVQNILYGSIR